VNERRIKILQLLADGYSPKEIAGLLHQTRSVIFKKLDRTRAFQLELPHQ
jgi:DNA-binding NarL/FixJ family response regulator